MEEETMDPVVLDTSILLEFFNSIVINDPGSFVEFIFPVKLMKMDNP